MQRTVFYCLRYKKNGQLKNETILLIKIINKKCF